MVQHKREKSKRFNPSASQLKIMYHKAQSKIRINVSKKNKKKNNKFSHAVSVSFGKTDADKIKRESKAL